MGKERGMGEGRLGEGREEGRVEVGGRWWGDRGLGEGCRRWRRGSEKGRVEVGGRVLGRWWGDRGLEV